MIRAEVVVVAGAYLLAALPIMAAYAAGKASPLYRIERAQLARWWSRMALGLVVVALAYNALGG